MPGEKGKFSITHSTRVSCPKLNVSYNPSDDPHQVTVAICLGIMSEFWPGLICFPILYTCNGALTLGFIALEATVRTLLLGETASSGVSAQR